MGSTIIVCVKQVPDPEGPPSSYKVDTAACRLIPRGIPPVISPFDQNALEAAIRIKESHGSRIILLSVGNSISRTVILKAAASGADEFMLLEGDEFDAARLDSRATAFLLAAAVRRIGEYALILCGRQASDTNAGQVGLGLGQILGIPTVSLARKVEVSAGTVIVERALPEGYEIVEAPLPALVTVTGELGDLRYPSLQALRLSKGIPHKILSPADLGMDPTGLRLLDTVSLAAPSRERICAMAEGKSPEEAGRWLAERLVRDRVL